MNHLVWVLGIEFGCSAKALWALSYYLRASKIAQWVKALSIMYLCQSLGERTLL